MFLFFFFFGSILLIVACDRIFLCTDKWPQFFPVFQKINSFVLTKNNIAPVKLKRGLFDLWYALHFLCVLENKILISAR